MSTVTSWGATRPIALYTSCMAGQRPTRASAVVLRLAPFRDRGRDAHQPADLERPVDQVGQVVQFERLEQVLVGPQPHRLDGRVGRPVPGDEDDRDLRVDLVDAAKRLQPGLAGQVDVEDDHVGPLPLDRLEPLGRGRRGEQGHVRPRERPAEEVQDRRLVVHHEQGRHDSSGRENGAGVRPGRAAGGRSRPRRPAGCRRRGCRRGPRRSAGTPAARARSRSPCC